tara:strand:- start:10649 stop:11800 length:1152 start_codon:yes stop_codon:yes gene_type:complete
LKIAFVITRSDAVGGAQIHVRDISTALRKAGHEAVVLAGGSGPWLEQLQERNIPVITLRHMQRSISPINEIRALFELRRHLRALAPDLVSTHTAKAGVLGRIAAASLRLPVMFTAHGWTFTDGISRLKATVWRTIEQMVGRLAGRIVTVSEFDRRLALQARIAAPERIIAIHNGMPDVGPELIADAGSEAPKLVMVARFEEQKDHRTLLLALATLKAKPWSLSLVGGGPLEAPMKALCAELDLQDRVEFLGPRSDVAQLLANAQVFVLCTLWEGLPRSIIEAMRAGLPVMATDVAGIPELVEVGATGLLCRSQNVEDAANKLSLLIESSQLRAEMGQRARQRYVEDFQFEQMLARTLQVYEQLIEKRGTSAENIRAKLGSSES